MHTILVVDDNTTTLMNLVTCLMAAPDDYQILTAKNGQKALEIIEKLPPQLIIIDWDMPVMDGITTIQHLKQNPDWASIPIIMHTGTNTRLEDLSKAFEAGVNDFLRKPTSPIEIQARVRSILLQHLYYTEKQRIKQEATQKNLQLKQNELTTLSLLIEQKNVFLEELQAQLITLQKSVSNSTIAKECQKLVLSINNNIHSESQWELIKTRINAIHENFTHKITEQHPELTPSDIKLASFIRLNMSNKEIAASLFIEPKSVEKKRTRLRKKLALESAELMKQYIFSL